MRRFRAFSLIVLMLSGCMYQKVQHPEESVAIEEPTIVVESLTVVESPKAPPIVREEEEEVVATPTISTYILTPVAEYHLNYITKFDLLALASVDEPIEEGISSVIHNENLPLSVQTYSPISDDSAQLKVEIQGSKFHLSQVDHLETEVKMAYLATEIDFQGCNSDRFVLYYQTNNQSKVYIDDSLVLTVDSMERIKSEGSLQSLPFELKSGETLLMLKCLVDANGTTGQLMLMPENASKQYKLEVNEQDY